MGNLLKENSLRLLARQRQHFASNQHTIPSSTYFIAWVRVSYNLIKVHLENAFRTHQWRDLEGCLVCSSHILRHIIGTNSFCSMPCIKGHRVAYCEHWDRILVECRAPGRPAAGTCPCSLENKNGGCRCSARTAFVIPGHRMLCLSFN